jgi:hypothetical protein
MRKKMLFLFAVSTLLLCWTGPVQPQILGNDPPVRLVGIDPQPAYQIIEMVLNEKGFKPGEFKPDEGNLFSDWITWTAVAITNRARIQFTAKPGDLSVAIVDRQYSSQEGWSEAIGNLSKKKYQEYVQSVADRIVEISKDPALLQQAIENSVLFPVFKAVNQVGDLTWKLVKMERVDSQKITFFWEVTNTGNNPCRVDIQMFDLYKFATGSGANDRAASRWSEHLESSPKITVIQPGATLTCQSKASFWAPDQIVRVVLKLEYQNPSREVKKLSIWNIPIPLN